MRLRNLSLQLTVGLTLLLAPVGEAWAQDVAVNLTDEKQLIQGYGGINHPLWIGDLTAAQRETAFGNGPNQLGFSILRIFISEDPNNWQREVATAQRAQELGLLVFASPWNPPASMATTINGEKHVNPQLYGQYAQHLTDFYNYMGDHGVDLYAVSIQNEPDYAEEWTWWSPDEIVTFLRDHAGSLPFRVIAPESFQYRKQLSDPILNDSAALANLDILGAHLYGTQISQFPYPLFKQRGAGKELWMTEVYYPNSEADSADRWNEALNLGWHLHSAMVEAEFQAYVWWYIRRSYGPMKEDGTISKRGYTMAHFSKFVRRGFVRVEATKSPRNEVFVSAYKHDREVVAVVVNRNASAQSLTFSVPGASISSYEKYTTSSSKSLSNDGTVAASNDSFTVTLDAQSVTTLRGTGTTTGGTGGTGGSGGSGGASGGTGGSGGASCAGDAQNAYQGTPASVPGTLEAEDFDPAGYSDATAGNEGGAYRTDVDADIKALGTGYAVGWMTAGEWLEYTVDVAVEGDYQLVVNAGAVEPGRTLEVSACGVPLATVNVPQISEWGEVGTVTTSPVHLAAGLQVLRLTVGASSYLDLDAVTFELVGGGTGGAGGATGGSGGGATGGTGPTGCVLDTDCDDSDLCTADACDPTAGTCTHAPISACCLEDADCSSASSCLQAACDTATHRCALSPIAGCCATAADCDDGNACTTEGCDATTGLCSVEPIAGCCQLDGDCADQSACTADTCDPATHTCVNAAIPGCAPGAAGTGGVPSASPSASDDRGCGCRAGGSPRRSAETLAFMALLAGAGIRRRRRRA